MVSQVSQGAEGRIDSGDTGKTGNDSPDSSRMSRLSVGDAFRPANETIHECMLEYQGLAVQGSQVKLYDACGLYYLNRKIFGNEQITFEK